MIRTVEIVQPNRKKLTHRENENIKHLNQLFFETTVSYVHSYDIFT